MDIVLVLLVIVSTISPSIIATPPHGFSVDLIHRNSPLSPFYDPSMNQSEALINELTDSISRANALLSRLNTTAHGIQSVAPLTANRGSYLMKFSVGNPPVDSYGLIDTGSEIIWIQCLPCINCFEQYSPIFIPSKSSTYQKISCDSVLCNLVRNRACGIDGVCRYKVNYLDGSFTSGQFGVDVISFGTSPPEVAPYAFGCGHENTGLFYPESSGIVGLGRGPLSMVSQLGVRIQNTFGYCLVPRTSQITTKIMFGSDALGDGSKLIYVPLRDKEPHNFYFLGIDAIYINAKLVVRPTTSNSDMIIDSGSTVTYLETSLYEAIEKAVKEAIGYKHEPLKDTPKPLKLCYSDSDVKIEELPEFYIIFSGANIGFKFHTYNIFATIRDKLCFLMAPSSGTSILGNMAQVNFKVVYDLDAKSISFKPMDCLSI